MAPPPGGGIRITSSGLSRSSPRAEHVHLADHVGTLEDPFGVVDHLGAGRGIVAVDEMGCCARITLHDHAVLVLDQAGHAERRQAHPVFQASRFLWDSDDHVATSSACGCRLAARGR
jgi:hypothetical protein